jgi:hypothetical protein
MEMLQDFFNASLTLKDYNISTWTVESSSGLWMGLGYGSA